MEFQLKEGKKKTNRLLVTGGPGEGKGGVPWGKKEKELIPTSCDGGGKRKWKERMRALRKGKFPKIKVKGKKEGKENLPNSGRRRRFLGHVL